MDCLVKKSRVAFMVMLLLTATLNGCSNKDAFTEKEFVGKWMSSRVTAPVYLYENGDWEIITNDGASQQYGVWQYKENKIMWTVRVDGRIIHDTNAVLSAAPREFRLREGDSSITTFSKLD